ncbi:MAG: hypothetical protein BJ554DRAFT_1983 [Olpidium bornovanus]|uniref:Uncharacterized protein n=1 Tax=Olpidium bornovanus TaxID=278681 RepID=A0A8H8DH03_9FUNG|nr:MAG: hypothetical protein BJ554DRAFT_1983 [Olpidium bornovanus]
MRSRDLGQRAQWCGPFGDGLVGAMMSGDRRSGRALGCGRLSWRIITSPGCGEVRRFAGKRFDGGLQGRGRDMTGWQEACSLYWEALIQV